MRIQLHVPAGQDLEVHVALAAMQFYVKAGDGIELTLADGEDASAIAVKAVPAGTGAQVAAEALAKAEEERTQALQAEQQDASADGSGDAGPDASADGSQGGQGEAIDTQAAREEQTIDSGDVGNLNEVLSPSEEAAAKPAEGESSEDPQA